MRAELAELKLKELKKRARAEGLSSPGRYWHLDAPHYDCLTRVILHTKYNEERL